MSLLALERLSNWIEKASAAEFPVILTTLAALQTLTAGRLLELAKARSQAADDEGNDEKHTG